MEGPYRGPLVVLEVAALGVILALVDDALVRVALGLMIALLLARSALAGGGEVGERPPSGLDDRRQDHLFRHWVNVLLKKVREFHVVCQGVASGGVNMAVGQLRIHEIEREINDLMNQVTESAKPSEMRKGWRARKTAEKSPSPDAPGDTPKDS